MHVLGPEVGRPRRSPQGGREGGAEGQREEREGRGLHTPQWEAFCEAPWVLSHVTETH